MGNDGKKLQWIIFIYKCISKKYYEGANIIVDEFIYLGRLLTNARNVMKKYQEEQNILIENKI